MTSLPTSGSPQKVKRRHRILKSFAFLLTLFIFAAAGLLLAYHLGWFDARIQQLIVSRIENSTGGKVELQRFHFDLFELRASLEGFTLHGREPEGTPPLFHADSLVAEIQIDSFWHKKISLLDLKIVHPQVHVRYNQDGSSNLPVLKPSQPGSKPLRVRVFEFAIHHLELDNGTLLYNDTRVPLAAEGSNVNFALDWRPPPASSTL